MKIEGPGRIGTAAPGKTGKVGGGGGDFSRLVEGEVAHTSSVAGAAPLSAVPALLGLQEVDDATERKSRAKRRATGLLDQMDSIRHCLLMGEMPPHELHALRARIAQEKVAVDDPRLKDLLDEIELRAEVELAKLEAASGKS